MNARTFTVSRVDNTVQNRLTRKSLAALKLRRRRRLEYLKFQDEYEAYLSEHQGDERDTWETRSSREVFEDLCREDDRF